MAEFVAGIDRILRIARKPRPLSTLRQAAEQLDETEYEASEEKIRHVLAVETWADPLHRVLRVALAGWDHEADGDWTDGTPPNSGERRARIYELLAIGPELREDLDTKIPFFSQAEPLLVIADRFEPWYTDERRAGSTFYWDAFARYLETVNGWEPEDALSLDESTRAVVERLSDPSRPEIYQAKGLVVGHVQSGKTANITGVIAKAADAGYRLVIVLSGTMNLLRAQTQRRIDRELMGKELIRPHGEVRDDEELDYILDEDWGNFIEHGGRPSERGAFDWIRLTGEVDDYRRLRAGIETLNFECRDPSKPFYAPDNLRPAKAKIMVVKKNAAVLGRVAKDLRQITARLADVPAVVIDDESDLASINTHRPPTREEERRRTAINRRIVELLQQLPRAQYVGYTATPFANVFVDPADAEDLFPKDFIVSLPRPKDYMGARDFHDLDGQPHGTDEDPYQSNRASFVRDVRGEDEDEDNLLRAIDAYVIAGAVKLFRQVELPPEATRRDPFRHHTMLVHSSRLVAEQAVMAEKARAALRAAGYEAGRGQRRLRELFERDFAPVTASRAPGLPMPSTFDRLHPYVGKALTFLWAAEDPVRVVNGVEGNDDPDFDKQRIWKIVVGGAKLSRGYTIEGLTVSYFRRTANAGDTLMQMGRWFGFRDLYQDLVRVFIGREEGHGRSYDIYEAFEGICRDEEAFREELQRYAMPDDGSEPITPMQVPPLVASHLEWVRPTARNKMFNAQIQFTNLGGRWREKTLAPEDGEREKRETNDRILRGLVESIDLERLTLQFGDRPFEAIVGIATAADVERVMEAYQWANGYRSLQRELEFMHGSGARNPDIRDWAFVAPQLAVSGKDRPWHAGGHEFSVKYRSRVGVRVGAYSEPQHRQAAEVIISPEPIAGASDTLEARRQAGRGVFLFYPVTHHEGERPSGEFPTMGFALLFPHNHIRSTIVFGVADPTRPDAPVVDQPAGQPT
jgi:hypothetical protein